MPGNPGRSFLVRLKISTGGFEDPARAAESLEEKLAVFRRARDEIEGNNGIY